MVVTILGCSQSVLARIVDITVAVVMTLIMPVCVYFQRAGLLLAAFQRADDDGKLSADLYVSWVSVDHGGAS